MTKKTLVALSIAASVGLMSPTMALARGGGGHGGGFGGGFHGGGFGGFHGGFAGGFHGGGFHGGGFHGGGFNGFHHGFGHGLAFGYGGWPYAYDGFYDTPYYAYDEPYVAGGDYGDADDCHVVRRRVHTSHGWRTRRVEVCS